MVETRAMTQVITHPAKEATKTTVKAILEAAEARSSTGQRNVLGSMGTKVDRHLLK